MKYRYSFLFLFFITALKAIDDTESWSSISLEIKAPYSSKFKIEQSLRLENQAREFKQTFTELSYYYKVNDFITLNIPYRYAIFEDKIKTRISFGSAFKYKIRAIILRYRLKLENSKEPKEKIEQTLRNKLSLYYKLNKKNKPFISYEAFNIYDDKLKKRNEDRVSIGVSIQFFKKNTIKVSYTYKREDLLKKHAEYFGVLGLDFNIEI